MYFDASWITSACDDMSTDGFVFTLVGEDLICDQIIVIITLFMILNAYELE